MLLVASLMQVHDADRANMTYSVWPEAILLVLEATFAGWLMIGAASRIALPLTAGLFAVFAAVSAKAIVVGADSCGCFGQRAVSPFLVFPFDVGVAAALSLSAYLNLKRWNNGSHQLLFRVFQRILWALNCVAVVGGIGIMSQLGTSRYVSDDCDALCINAPSQVERGIQCLVETDIGSGLPAGCWLVIVANSDCMQCRQELNAYNCGEWDGYESASAVQVAVVDVGTGEHLLPSRPWVLARLRRPCASPLVGVKLVHVIDGLVVSPNQFYAVTGMRTCSVDRS